ncbi:MAG: undecaprenyl-phosphate glucose phosphotransferase [Pseudomonadota bacterium]|nr:undecaprenyl-phosphate glucose phosphotransferase [Pseudomonadota bacterium]
MDSPYREPVSQTAFSRTQTHTDFLTEHAQWLSWFLRVGDFGVVIGTAWLAYLFRFQAWDMAPVYRMAALIAALLVLAVFARFGLYNHLRGKTLGWISTRLISAIALVTAILVTLAFLTKTGPVFSRQWTAYWAMLATANLVVYRGATTVFLGALRSAGLNTRRVLVVGAGKLGQCVTDNLKKADWAGFQVVGYADDDPALQGETHNDLKIFDNNHLADLVTEKAVDEVWIALPLTAQKRVDELLHAMRHSNATVRMVPDFYGYRLLNRPINNIAGLAVLDLSSSPLSIPSSRFIKAVVDWVLAAAILVLISPVMLLIALGVKLSSPGPILFKQVRHGVNNKPIVVYKFRTMVEHKEQDGKVTQAKRDDDRITPLGRFLRRTSLDELPQFINVLQGRMAIVGPRPHACAHNDHYRQQVAFYTQRHEVKPGITGWAQVNGWRGETDCVDKMCKRVEHDLYYIQNWSVFFDLRIIFLTVLRGFTDKNAY